MKSEHWEATDVLYRILRCAVQPGSLKETFAAILDLLFDVPWLEIEHKGSIFLRDDNRQLHMVAQRSLSDELCRVCETIDFGHCLCGKAAQSSALVFRAHLDHDHDVHFPGMADHGHYCQPILWNGEVVGVLNLYVAAGHVRRETETVFLAAVADTLAGIFARTRSEKARTLAMQLAATREKHFANALINNLPGIFYMVNSDGQLIRWNDKLAACTGYSDEELGQMHVTLLAATDDREVLALTLRRALAGDPVSVELALVARGGSATPYFLNVSNVQLGEFEGLAVVGMGIDISYRKEMEERLLELAMEDALTGALNRRAIEKHLDNEIKVAHRHTSPLAIIFFDIDHFKRVNDCHGHDNGDLVLKLVVAAVRGCMRGHDFLARWGGEEFLIAARQTDLEGGHVIAEKVRREIERLVIPGVGSVTISLGVAQLAPQENPDQLVKRADGALYAAKRNGRNQVARAS